MKKPDRVADNKFTMPYGDSVSAPAITEVDTTGYREIKSKEASAKLRGRYKELQEEFTINPIITIELHDTTQEKLKEWGYPEAKLLPIPT